MSVVKRPGNKLPPLATGFASDGVHRAGDEASDDGLIRLVAPRGTERRCALKEFRDRLWSDLVDADIADIAAEPPQDTARVRTVVGDPNVKCQKSSADRVVNGSACQGALWRVQANENLSV
jgi:hypothetical protein